MIPDYDAYGNRIEPTAERRSSVFSASDELWLRDGHITLTPRSDRYAEYRERIALLGDASARAREIEHLTTEVVDNRDTIECLLWKLVRREQSIGWLIIVIGCLLPANFILLIFWGASR